MRTRKDEWAAKRSKALHMFYTHLNQGLVDADIAEFLVEINSKTERMFTTSSCSGRVVILAGRDPLDKRGSTIEWVTHNPRECRESLCSDIRRITLREMSWLSLQPPIMHFYAYDEDTALTIVGCGRSAGFTRSCYRREGDYYFVEVAAHDKTHVILPAPCDIIIRLCDILEKYKERLKTFIACIKSNLDRGT